MKAPDKKSGKSTTSTAAPPKRARQLLPVRLSSSWVGAVPADKTFAYSEADWQSIKVSLDRIGIDADAVTVPDRWWAHPDPAAALVAEPELIGEKKQWVLLAKRPLREQLQELAADYRGLAGYRKQGDSLTPRQEAAEIQEILNKLEAARAALNSRLLDFIPQTAAVGPKPQTAVAREALTVIIDRAKRLVDKLTAQGSRSSENARKTHIEYWDALALLWRAITADQNRRPHERGLNSFLLACSKSVFPDETSKSNIKNFRQNFRRKGVNDWRTSSVVLPF